MLGPPLDWSGLGDPLVVSGSGKPTTSPDSRHAISELQHKVERQHLFIQTLLRLLMEKGLIQENEFREWLTFVDGFDGHVDGKLKPDTAPQLCSSCARKSPASYPRCQYCGAEFAMAVLETDRRKS